MVSDMPCDATGRRLHDAYYTPLVLQPIPCIGHEQLWELPAEVAEGVRAQLRDGRIS